MDISEEMDNLSNSNVACGFSNRVNNTFCNQHGNVPTSELQKNMPYCLFLIEKNIPEKRTKDEKIQKKISK